jgi:hypothetical protein
MPVSPAAFDRANPFGSSNLAGLQRENLSSFPAEAIATTKGAAGLDGSLRRSLPGFSGDSRSPDALGRRGAIYPGVAGISGADGLIRRAVRSRPSFPEYGRLRLIDFPIEKVVIAGPGVNLDPTNLASKAAGMPGRMLLPGRGVGQTAIGAAEIFGGPNGARHGAIMQRIARIFQRCRLPSSRTC